MLIDTSDTSDTSIPMNFERKVEKYALECNKLHEHHIKQGSRCNNTNNIFEVISFIVSTGQIFCISVMAGREMDSQTIVITASILTSVNMLINRISNYFNCQALSFRHNFASAQYVILENEFIHGRDEVTLDRNLLKYIELKNNNNINEIHKNFFC